jgi:YYY domain-containing protein
MEWGLVIIWFATFQILTLLGAPLTALIFPSFPDRGIAVALPLALVIVTSLVFWIGHITFGSLALLSGLLGLGLLTTIAIVRGSTLPLQWRPYIEVALVFTLAFGVMIAIRAVDPAVSPGSGEAFLDFGIFQSLLRAEQLPPEDMWYAGEPVRYYYGGHLIAALLAKLTGTAGQYAYNLALAGFYAMLVTSAYGVARAIATARGVPARAAGVFAAFFVGFASNIYTPVGLVLGLLPDALATRLINLFGLKSDIIPTLYPFHTGAATRVIGKTINEFPLFGFLYGHLHAYLTSTPFLILLVALLFAYFRTPESDLRHRWLLLGSVVPVIGVITVIDTWSFPTTCGLLFLTLVFSEGHPLSLLPDRAQAVATDLVSDGGMRNPQVDVGSRIGVTVVITATIGMGCLLWILPFITQTASSRPIGVLPDRSPLAQFLLVQGAFLLVFALYFLPRVRPLLPPGETRRLLGLFALLVVVGSVTNVGVLVLVGPLLAIAALLQWERRDLGYEGILFVGGAGLVLLVEFVYIQDGAAPGRINTVFKIYMQAWILWSLAIGVALTSFVAPFLSRHRFWEHSSRREKLVPVGVAALLLSVSLYGGLALTTHFTIDSPPARTDDPTLNALAFVKTQHPEEAEAIAWLNRRPGQPTMVEAPGLKRYRWENAPSSLTGVPTVAGWAHEIGYRDPLAYVERVAKVKLIFTGEPVVQARLLKQFDVNYIYVGPKEQKRYDLAPFDRRPWLTVAYKDDYVTIYEVNKAMLADRTG